MKQDVKKTVERDHAEASVHLRLLEKSVVRRARMRRIDELLDRTRGLDCLAISGDPALHMHLAARGGTWTSAAWSREEALELEKLLGRKVSVVNGNKLSFGDGEYDRILVAGGLEYVEDDYGFVADCHRVLTDAGFLILNVPYLKRWPLMRPLRRVFGLEEAGREPVRRGYSDSALFDILKDGFDVDTAQHYSRFFTEFSDAFFRWFGGFFVGGSSAGDVDEAMLEKIHRYLSIVFPLAWAASCLDVLIFFTRGYTLVAKARRRIWKPRRIPKLCDGRSIAEATLKTKIGTAAPF